MLRILASPEADQARAILAQKLLEFRSDGMELRPRQVGFVCGAEEVIRDSQGTP